MSGEIRWGEGAGEGEGEGEGAAGFVGSWQSIYSTHCGPCSCDYRVSLDVYDMIGIKYVPWR